MKLKNIWGSPINVECIQRQKDEEFEVPKKTQEIDNLVKCGYLSVVGK